MLPRSTASASRPTSRRCSTATSGRCDMTSVNVAASLTETITVTRISALSAGGDPTRATTLTLKARIQRANSDVTMGAGRDNVDSDVVFTTTALVVGDL